MPSEVALLRSLLLRAFLPDELTPIDEYAGSKTLAMTARAQLVDFSTPMCKIFLFGVGERCADSHVIVDCDQRPGLLHIGAI